MPPPQSWDDYDYESVPAPALNWRNKEYKDYGAGDWFDLINQRQDFNEPSYKNKDLELPSSQTRLIPGPAKPSGVVDFMEDPTRRVREYFHNKQDDEYGPSDTPLPTDLLGLFSQSYGPEGAAPAHMPNVGHALEATTPLFPRAVLKSRAEKLADTTFRDFTKLGAPKTAEVLADVVAKHPYVTGNLSRLRPINDRAYSAAYGGPLSTNELRALIERPHEFTTHADKNMRDAASILKLFPQEQRRDMLLKAKLIPTIYANPDVLENQTKDFIYETGRHELSHGVDDIYRPDAQGVQYPHASPEYLVSRREARARAVAKNYLRDMGDTEANRSVLLPSEVDPHTGQQLYGPDTRRKSYSENLAEQLQWGVEKGQRDILRGSQFAGGKTPEEIRAAMDSMKDVAADTYRHFYEPDASHIDLLGNTVRSRPARLRPGQRLNMMDAPEGLWEFDDIIRSTKGW